MNKYKLSPWHDGSVKPIHKGVYEIARFRSVTSSNETMFSYFDGELWRGWKFPHEFMGGVAPNKKDFDIYGQDRAWRGILKD